MTDSNNMGKSMKFRFIAVVIVFFVNMFLLPIPADAAVNVLSPVASGAVVDSAGGVTLDASNASQGYIMIKRDGAGKRIKVQIIKGTTYTYDINSTGSYEVFPLTEGNGNYTVKVFENIAGTKYSQLFTKTISVNLVNQTLPFLYPNQYVNFNANTSSVKAAENLTKNEPNEIKKVEIIYNYTISAMSYDVNKANSVQAGYLPNIDAVLASKKGICFDYAAVMASMLRSQGIATKLVVGYTGKVYHAWISVYTPQTGWVDGMIYFDGKQWKLMDPTFASSGNKNKEILKYIGNAANYQAKYAY
ncbi:MAG: transglutaminase-like domain-containing protein [Eubacteriales bacterium]